MTDCIDLSESNYDRLVSYYRSNYEQVEFSYKRVKFAYSGGRVDHHMLLVSYVTHKGWFGDKWAYALYDNHDSYSFSKWDEVDNFIRAKYNQYEPYGTMEIYTENFYKGAKFWERLSGEDANW